MSDQEGELKATYERLRAGVRANWDRDLPLDELVADRWRRARELGFGEGSSIYGLSYVYGDVTVGRNVWVGPYTLLDGTGGLWIGDYVSISAGVHLYTHDTVAWAVSGGRAGPSRAPVRIGDRTYIGSQSIVAKGVTIGEGSVIGAGAFVNRDIPPGSYAVGTPCRVIGRVEVGNDGSVQLVVTEGTPHLAGGETDREAPR